MSGRRLKYSSLAFKLGHIDEQFMRGRLAGEG